METSVPGTVSAEFMLRHHLYSDNNDRMKHFGEIQSLADEFKRSITQVAQMYEEVLESLSAQATVTDFLPVLVSKKVRQHCIRSNICQSLRSPSAPTPLA